MRPLDALRSLKLKLGVVILAAVVVTVVVVSLGDRAGLSPFVTGVAAGALALAMVQLLAHGMTFPLREMAAAARAMAAGDYTMRVTATSRDEVGELARAFNRMAEDLAAADRMRRDLVANAAHELRTPIGALGAMLENLVDGIQPADRPALEAMLRQVERLGGLVEQLLDLSRLESGAVPLEREPIRAATLLGHVVEEWRPRARDRDVELESAVEAGLVLHGDEQRLHQVLANLVANAIRHSPAGGRVVLRGSAVDGLARLEVADQGSGIPAREAERVFERFYRLDEARASTDGGAGLGLAIARWIVELHGGSIRAEAANPHGCRIVVDLPR
ncbi:MAG: ATP-binding protein [Actinomycetota bacterium]|nr:ATP-binding protein [Actinomycetota bacterium]